MKKCVYPIFLSAVLLLLTNWLSAQTITTIAGGTIGDDSLATTIGISSTPSIVTDAAENLYFLDQVNYRIRKIDAVTGIVSTVAGNGTQSPVNDGGPAVNAGMSPTYMAIDRLGNLYVSSARTIRKIDAVTGVITIIAGNGTGGFSGDGGPAINAQIASLNAIALDTAGNLYFTDIYRIRKVDAVTNIITTICGNGVSGNTGDGGLAVNAQIVSPLPTLIVDPAGNLLIGDNNSKVIRKIDFTTGIITKIAGVGGAGSTGDGGPAIAAKLAGLTGMAYDAAGNLYVTDNNKIRKIDAVTGIINTVIGTGVLGYSGDGGNAANANFNGTRALAFTASGSLYIVDDNNYVIRKVAATTNIITTICGNHTARTSGFGGPASAAQLYQMNSMAIDNTGNTYIADNSNNKIYRIDAAGIITIVAGTGATGTSGDGGLATAARLTNPWGITVDAAGNFYFADNNYKVRKVTVATGIISTVAGNGVNGYSGDGGPATAASLNVAISLAVDPAGNLYIADKQNNRVRKVTAATGIITTIAGTGTAGYTGDGGPATSAQLNMPLAITVDYAGNIYVSQQSNPAVRRIDAVTGIITTIAGTGIMGLSGDGGPANMAMIGLTLGITTDSAGNVFMADLRGRIRKVDITTGIINSIAGTNDIGYNGDNIPATTAWLNNPVSVGIDGAGNLLIVDRDNFRIRKVTFDGSSPAARVAITNSTAVTTPNGTITTRVYPNPAHESVAVSLKTAMQGKATISLTDMWGRLLIRQQKTVQENGLIITVLPLHQLAKGIYMISVSVNDTTQIHQLLIQ